MAVPMPTRWIKKSVAPRLTSLFTTPLVLGCMACDPAAALPDCASWNSASFFREASADDVARCLSQGADLNARTRFVWETPLHMAAAFSETPAVIKALLDAGADLNARTNKIGWTPLHMAASSSETPAVVQVLLNAGADLSARGEGGWTPLHVAARSSETPAVVQVLLDAGADLSTRDEDGETPLHTAAVYSKTPAMVQTLLDAGADLNARDEDGWTPLHWAAAFSETPAVVQTLLDTGADLNARTRKSGLTPLHVAAENSETPAVVQVLLDAGADTQAQTDNGLTALDLIPDDSPLRSTDVCWQFKDARVLGTDACIVFDTAQALPECSSWNSVSFFEEASADDVARCLLEGADANAQDKNGVTSLHLAARHSKTPAVVQVLLDAGADVSTRTHQIGWTPLHAAAFSETPAVVQALLDAGA
ncbi:MAG: ankyrin repeat domain-containing protein, partial [Cyanobacteria bacterium MAG IRC3_bin_20]|nr:ankyrin repeat domain-containing protein [Cyanobacteria bacterium MAG IRC3_bin_20]